MGHGRPTVDLTNRGHAFTSSRVDTENSFRRVVHRFDVDSMNHAAFADSPCVLVAGARHATRLA
jgi:hypothetical protein